MNKITNCLINKDTSCFPVWFMRQAGRYLPEFRSIRSKNPDFIKLCLDSDLSSQIDDSEKYHEDYKEGECCLGMKKQTVPIMKQGYSYPIFQRKCQVAERWVCNDLKKEGERGSDCAGSELPTTDAHNRSLVQVRHKT